MDDSGHIKLEDLRPDAVESLNRIKEFANARFKFKFEPQEWIDTVYKHRKEDIDNHKSWIFLYNDLISQAARFDNEKWLLDPFVWSIPDKIATHEQWLKEHEHKPLELIIYNKMEALINLIEKIKLEEKQKQSDSTELANT